MDASVVMGEACCDCWLWWCRKEEVDGQPLRGKDTGPDGWDCEPGSIAHTHTGGHANPFTP